MPFIHPKRQGRRTRRDRALARRFDEAVARTWRAVHGRGRCLPMCVLLTRVLRESRIAHRLTLRLGAVNVFPLEPTNGQDAIGFDPRHPDGIDAGFHAWLEDDGGRLLDPSILMTLAAEGYDVKPMSYVFESGRRFSAFGLAFLYEELPQLELLGLDASEDALASLLRLALEGVPHPPLFVQLDVGWRPGTSIPEFPTGWPVHDDEG